MKANSFALNMAAVNGVFQEPPKYCLIYINKKVAALFYFLKTALVVKDNISQANVAWLIL